MKWNYATGTYIQYGKKRWKSRALAELHAEDIALPREKFKAVKAAW
jgi:hypothetical protein